MFTINHHLIRDELVLSIELLKLIVSLVIMLCNTKAHVKCIDAKQGKHVFSANCTPDGSCIICLDGP